MRKPKVNRGHLLFYIFGPQLFLCAVHTSLERFRPEIQDFPESMADMSEYTAEDGCWDSLSVAEEAT